MENKEIVPYEAALELKDLGFDEPCLLQWTYAPELIFCTSAWGQPKLKTNQESHSDSGGDCISAPTFSQVFRWFRKKHQIDAWVQPYMEEKGDGTLLLPDGSYSHFVFRNGVFETDEVDFSSQEEAELACLRQMLEAVKRDR